MLLVDDHAVVREGVRRLMSNQAGIVLREASSGEEALAQIQTEQMDIVLLDLNLRGAGGLELLRRLVLEYPSIRVIVFSMHTEPIYAARALRLGARGYVSKSAPSEELVTAVERVAEGELYVERALAAALAVSPYAGADPLQRLTTREIEILRLLGDGKSLSAIADALGVSYKTVANTCSLMKSKLGLERTADLIRTSIELLRR